MCDKSHWLTLLCNMPSFFCFFFQCKKITKAGYRKVLAVTVLHVFLCWKRANPLNYFSKNFKMQTIPFREKSSWLKPKHSLMILDALLYVVLSLLLLCPEDLPPHNSQRYEISSSPSNLSGSSCTAVNIGRKTDESRSKTQMFSGTMSCSGALPVSQLTHNREIHFYQL